jgi:hypothetical protein
MMPPLLWLELDVPPPLAKDRRKNSTGELPKDYRKQKPFQDHSVALSACKRLFYDVTIWFKRPLLYRLSYSSRLLLHHEGFVLLWRRSPHDHHQLTNTIRLIPGGRQAGYSGSPQSARRRGGRSRR